MFGLGQAQYYVTLALTIAALALEVFAFVHALKTRPDAFVAAGKRTKNFWLAVLIAAAVFSFLGFLALVALVASIVYLVDVRPRVREYGGGSGGPQQHMGPYGPW